MNHYTLDRDRPARPDPPKVKACKKCGNSKPNDFMHFGKKLEGSRTNLVTNDVCKACLRAQVSESMRRRWAEKREELAHDPLVALRDGNT